jgi:hypothetical protein
VEQAETCAYAIRITVNDRRFIAERRESLVVTEELYERQRGVSVGASRKRASWEGRCFAARRSTAIRTPNRPRMAAMTVSSAAVCRARAASGTLVEESTVPHAGRPGK